MAKFVVNTVATVSCWTEVDADSAEQAKAIAATRPLAALCHMPFSGDIDEAWHFESDGEPDASRMEANEA